MMMTRTVDNSEAKPTNQATTQRGDEVGLIECDRGRARVASERIYDRFSVGSKLINCAMQQPVRSLRRSLILGKVFAFYDH